MKTLEQLIHCFKVVFIIGTDNAWTSNELLQSIVQTNDVFVSCETQAIISTYTYNTS